MAQTWYVNESKEDLNQPIFAIPLFVDDLPIVHESARIFNEQAVGERETHGRRTRIRVGFEVWARTKGGPLAYRRLREKHIVLSCPSARQAKAAVELIRTVCSQLEGKFLAEPTE